MDTMGQSVQVLTLRELLSSTLVAAVDADTATSGRYFDNLCEIAFDSFDPRTNEAGNLRTLTFSYTDRDGLVQSLNIPVLSLVPLPLLQISDADFGFNVCVVDMLQPAEEEPFSLDDGLRTDAEEWKGDGRALLRVALLPFRADTRSGNKGAETYMPNMKMNVKLRQADLPGGLTRFLQLVNNMDFKSNVTNKTKDDAKHE